MILCPSCGFDVTGDLCLGCPSCGARAVGPPLARAEHQLPSFGRAALAFVMGAVMVLAFLVLLITILIENKSSPLGFWTVVTAGEIAAWQVKWEVLFASIITLTSGARIIRSIRQDPSRFMGLLPARMGFGGALTVVVLVTALIAITVPARLQQRQYSIDAAVHARYHTIHRALLEYRDLHGTFPTDQDKYVEALRTVPDPDGSIAEALRFAAPNGYTASTVVAAASTKTKPIVARGVALRYANTPANPEPAAVSFTSYELRLSGEHRLFASDDDFVMHDGVVEKVSETTASSSSRRNP